MLSPRIRDGRVADEVRAEDERLRNAVRLRLRLVAEAHAEVRAVPEQLLDARQIARRADDQHLADAGEHQCAERVVDRRLVVDGQELLADAARQRIQPRPRAACQDDALHARSKSEILSTKHETNSNDTEESTKLPPASV